jgi:hypothetical protein
MEAGENFVWVMSGQAGNFNVLKFRQRWMSRRCPKTPDTKRLHPELKLQNLKKS